MSLAHRATTVSVFLLEYQTVHGCRLKFSKVGVTKRAIHRNSPAIQTIEIPNNRTTIIPPYTSTVQYSTYSTCWCEGRVLAWVTVLLGISPARTPYTYAPSLHSIKNLEARLQQCPMSTSWSTTYGTRTETRPSIRALQFSSWNAPLQQEFTPLSLPP